LMGTGWVSKEFFYWEKKVVVLTLCNGFGTSLSYTSGGPYSRVYTIKPTPSGFTLNLTPCDVMRVPMFKNNITWWDVTWVPMFKNNRTPGDLTWVLMLENNITLGDLTGVPMLENNIIPMQSDLPPSSNVIKYWHNLNLPTWRVPYRFVKYFGP
jgi:hypothetical protein